MKQVPWATVLLAAFAAGCVSKQDATSSAVRLLNAVADAPRMALIVNGDTKASGYDYGVGTPYVVQAAGAVPVRIDEALPADATPNYRTLYNEVQDLAANDELTLVVVGQAAGHLEEVVPIASTTRGVPTGKTRIQFMHAALGLPAVDVYLLPPGTLPTASAPFTAGLAYKAYTGQAEVTGGSSEIVVTAAGDPSTVLFDSGSVYLPLEGTWMAAIIANPGIDAAERPISLTVLSGTGSGVILDKAAKSQARFVNASPGSYAIDSFVNVVAVDDTARQECDPLTTEATTLLEECAQPFGAIGAFHAVAPGVYDVKTQKAADDAVAAVSRSGTLAAGAVSTFVTYGLIADTATATTTGLVTIAGARRVATAAQLRIINVSQAAVATLDGDPTTDRLELYITPPCASLAGESPDFYNLVAGSDIGYRSYPQGDYQLTLARGDTAAPDAAPEVLLSKRVTLASGGVYTELITDSPGGVLPAAFLSLDDDPGLQDCPAPP